MTPRSIHSLFRSFLRADEGAAASELAIWAVLIVTPLASVADLGIFAFQGMQVQTAVQAGVQAARTACRSYEPPYTSTCAGLTGAVDAAVHTTTLGTSVARDTAYPKEGYYCASTSEVLTVIGSDGTVGAPPAKPSPYTCKTVIAGSGALPGDYIKVKVNYTYTPLFSGVSVASLLPSTISRTAWIRMR